MSMTPIPHWQYLGLNAPGGRPYDVSLDGQRFLVIKEGGTEGRAAEIVVVENWLEELKRLVPTE